jgi:hypothetical protein
LDEIPRVAAGDDAPACDGEWIEIGFRGFRSGRRSRLAGSPFSAVTQQLLGESASARFLGSARLCCGVSAIKFGGSDLL